MLFNMKKCGLPFRFFRIKINVPENSICSFHMRDCFTKKIRSMQQETENPLDLLNILFSAREARQAEEAYAKIEQHRLEITAALRQYFYSIEDETKQRLFIRNFHAQVVILCDKLFSPTENRATEIQKHGDKYMNTPRSTLLIIEDLSAFTWSHFPVCCAPYQKIPIS